MVKGINVEFVSNDESPHNWQWINTKILMPDGSWLTEDKGRKVDLVKVCAKNLQWHETHDYFYFTRSGVNQSCRAQISVYEWRWTYKPTGQIKISRRLRIRFSEPIGATECTGCDHEMLPDETPLQTLRRMEKERTF